MTTQANVEQNKLPTSAVLPIVLALLVAIFAFQLNASMLSPALATMERELNATTAEIGPYPRILDTGCDYAAVGSVAARRAS